MLRQKYYSIFDNLYSYYCIIFSISSSTCTRFVAVAAYHAGYNAGYNAG